MIILIACILLYVAMQYPGERRHAPILDVTKFAHRGIHDNQRIPENSMPAFLKAKELGYGIELDVQLTKDKVMVIHHDYDLARTCGVKHKIADLTYQQLMRYPLMGTKETIPKFLDVLNAIDGKVPLLIELKMEKCDKLLCQLSAEALDHYQGLYCMESFHPYALWWYKKHRPEVMRGQLGDQFWKEKEEYRKFYYWIVQNQLTNWLTHPDFLAYRYRHDLSTPLIINRKLFHTPVYGWTFRSKEEYKKHKKNFHGFIFEGFML